MGTKVYTYFLVLTVDTSAAFGGKVKFVTIMVGRHLVAWRRVAGACSKWRLLFRMRSVFEVYNELTNWMRLFSSCVYVMVYGSLL